MPSSPRRFPPPWTIEELNDACFIVKDVRTQREDAMAKGKSKQRKKLVKKAINKAKKEVKKEANTEVDRSDVKPPSPFST
jgi:hypothetical protein